MMLAGARVQADLPAGAGVVGECGSDFLPDFKRFKADARTNGGDQLRCGSRSAQSGDCCASDICQGAAPAGVSGGDKLAGAVRYQNRGTICATHAGIGAGVSRHDRIGVSKFAVCGCRCDRG